uniref:Uncharacterized protein n=1 Tax=Parascaris univalens TaxID=6257 RepID=A0A915BUC6_PARUN
MMPFVSTRNGIGTRPIANTIPFSGLSSHFTIPSQANSAFVRLTTIQQQPAVYPRAVVGFCSPMVSVPTEYGWDTRYAVSHMSSLPTMELHNGIPATNYSSQPSPVNYTSAVATGFGVGCTTFHLPYNVQQPVQPTVSQTASASRFDVLAGGGIPLVASPFQPYQWSANQYQPVATQGLRYACAPLQAFGQPSNIPILQPRPQSIEPSSETRRPLYERRGVWHDTRATAHPMESNMFAEGIANPENISNENAFNWAFEGEDIAAAMNAPLDQIHPNHLEVERAREGSPLPSLVNESLLESLEGIDMDESVGLSLESSEQSSTQLMDLDSNSPIIAHANPNHAVKLEALSHSLDAVKREAFSKGAQSLVVVEIIQNNGTQDLADNSRERPHMGFPVSKRQFIIYLLRCSVNYTVVLQ